MRIPGRDDVQPLDVWVSYLAESALEVGKMPCCAAAMAGNLLPVIGNLADNEKVL